jgi:hypothetical protein
MRGHSFYFIAILTAALALPLPVEAQLSPRGVMGAFTAPFRQMLGHHPRLHRHHAREAQTARAAPAQPAAAGIDALPGWPSAYDDALGFIFWPADYAQKVRSRGFDVLAAAVLETPRKPASAATTGASDSASAPCNGADGTQGAWLAGRIEQTVDLTPTQRDALGHFKDALAQSIKTIEAACQDTSAMPPINRLNAVTQRLWAVRDAAIYVRAPLEAFYNSLGKEQKAKFAWTPPQPQQDAKAANAGMTRQFQACAGQGMAASEKMLKTIEQEARPTAAQADSMEALRKTTSDMAKMLSASCAAPVPADPPARLDSANAELSSLSYAATSEQIALNNFYAQLDQQQKQKFDSIGQ